MVQLAPNPAEVTNPAPERLYSLDTLARRIEQVRAAMHEKGVDSMMVSHPYNRNYLIGFGGHDQPPLDTAGILLIGPDDLCLVTDGRYVIQCEGELYPELGIKVVARTGKLSTALAEQISARKCKRLGFETAHLLHMLWRALDKSLPDTELIPIAKMVEPLRLIKDQDESRIMRRAIEISDQAFNIVSSRIEPGMTETQVAWDIEKTMRELGADERAFGASSGPGRMARWPMRCPANASSSEGEPIVIDMGAHLDGYNSDMTRTIILGEPTDKFREIYNIVLKANLEVSRQSKAGHDRRRDQPDRPRRNCRGGLRRPIQPWPGPWHRPRSARRPKPQRPFRGHPAGERNHQQRARHLYRGLGRRPHRRPHPLPRTMTWKC